jgi:hypothetical protein
MFVTVRAFHHNDIFTGKAGAYPSDALSLRSRLLPCPRTLDKNESDGQLTNTLAYYDTELITIVKSFTVQALVNPEYIETVTGACTMKLVIYRFL